MKCNFFFKITLNPSVALVELKPEQLEKTLHDMSERLDNMDRQSESPQVNTVNYVLCKVTC